MKQLRIIISSAVIMDEKNKVKECLFDMERQGLLNISEIYDCNDHSSTLSGENAGLPKQEEIDRKIHFSDWFICLAPESHVGNKTRDEIMEAAKALKTWPLAISLFHPIEPVKTVDTTNRVAVSEVIKQFNDVVNVNTEQYWVSYTYDDQHQDLLTKLKEEFVKLEKDLKFPSQRLSAYSEKGIAIHPEQLFYDINRTNPEYGFNDNFYIRRRSVDERLEQYLRDVNNKFVFIKGRPSSGKSRALLECLHGELKNEQIVVMNRDNATDVCMNLQHEILLDEELRRCQVASTFCETYHYFVADQVRDVLQTVTCEKRRQFLETVSRQPNCKLIGTSTPQPLDNFLDDHKDVFSEFEYGGNYSVVDIPLLSHDSESSSILGSLRHHYGVDTGETIGDFIPALTGYKDQVVEQLIKKANETGFSYLSMLLSSLQLVMTFRHSTPLFLAVMLLRNKYKYASEEEFAKGCAGCINYLLQQNIIWVNDVLNGEVKMLDAERDFAFGDYQCDTYDGEVFKNIVSINYVFTVNDLIWEHLMQIDERRDNQHFFYDLFTQNGIRQAFGHFFNTFPTASSLRRFLPRIPKRRKWLDLQGDEQRTQLIWSMTRQLVDKIDKDKQQKDEMKNLYLMLISRANSIVQVDDVLKKLQDEGYCMDSRLIGEMYFFSRKLPSSSPEHLDFLARIEACEKELEKNPATFDDFYCLPHHITARNLSFTQALELTNNVISRLKVLGSFGNRLEGLNAVVEECRDETSFVRKGIEYLLVLFAKLCSNIENVKELASLYHNLQFFPTPKTLHSIAPHLQDKDSITAILDILMPALSDRKKEERFYKQFVGSILGHLNSLMLSSWLCDKMKEELGIVRIFPECL